MSERRLDLNQKISSHLKKYNQLTYFRKDILKPVQSNSLATKQDNVSFFPLYVFSAYTGLALAFYCGFFSQLKNKLHKVTIVFVGTQAVYWIMMSYGKNQIYLNSLNRDNEYGYWMRQQYYKEFGNKGRWHNLDKRFEDVYVNPASGIDSKLIQEYLK